MQLKALVYLVGLLFTLACTGQGFDAFHPGPAIPSFGKIASVDSDMDIPKDTEFNISFDVGKQATTGEINRTFDSAARFINMHVDAGVPLDNIQVAIVVHGSAFMDVLTNEQYKQKPEGKDNANIDAIAALLENNTEIYLCGQTAAYRGVTKADLVPGVTMALSAMTAHALLLQQGFTPNPF